MAYRGLKVNVIVKLKYLSGSTLARPDRSRRFYINIYWSKYGMELVRLQANVSAEAIHLETQEKDAGTC